jgi:ribose 5-phosphate isomerase B
MRIAVGADHAGYDLKELVARTLREQGHVVLDLGTDRADVSVDYPDFGAAVAREVVAGRVDLGICACGTGIGISIAANKVAGARAALVHDVTTASLARRHNHANVLCMGGRTTGPAVALDALAAFLDASPEHGRHDERIEKIAQLDETRVGSAEAPAAPTPPMSPAGRAQ